MRNGLTVGVISLVLLASGCARRAPVVMAPASVPPIQSAASKAASLTVMRNPEAAPGLLGSFNIINGRAGAETLRFFGNRNAIAQVTLQMGPDRPRGLTPTEAKRYAELLVHARPDPQTNELRAMLAGWTRSAPQAAAGPGGVQAMSMPRNAPPPQPMYR